MRLLITVILFSLPRYLAAETVTLQLDHYVELEESGLRLRPLRGFDLQPLPSLTTRTYENTGTGERQDLHQPSDFFAYQQREAILSGDIGSIEIAILRYAPPQHIERFNSTLATAQTLETALKQPQPAQWQDDDLDAWVASYTGYDIDLRTTRLRDFPLLLPYIAYTFSSPQAVDDMAYIMRLPDSRYVFFLFHFNEQVTIANKSAATAATLASLRGTRPEANRRSPNDSFQIFDNSDRDDEQLRTRQKVIRNLRNLDNWWYVETPNYILASDLGPDNRELVLTIQQNVEQLRQLFALLTPPVVDISQVSVIRVFADRDDYLRYVPGDLQWTSGAWLPAQDELIVSPPIQTKNPADQDHLLQMVYHEAFHQYSYYAMDRHAFPVWYDEGHAALVEGSVFNLATQTLHIHEAKRYQELLLPLIQQGDDDILSFLSMTDEAFYRMDRHRSYPLVWALVYFLRKAAPIMKDQPYRGFCELIHRQVAARQGTAQELYNLLSTTYDLDRLQRDFHAFWTSREAREKAENSPLFP